MLRKVGSILAVSGFHQIAKRGLAIRKAERPPKILITGMWIMINNLPRIKIKTKRIL